MRAVFADHELLPKGLELESINVESERVSIRREEMRLSGLRARLVPGA